MISNLKIEVSWLVEDVVEVDPLLLRHYLQEVARQEPQVVSKFYYYLIVLKQTGNFGKKTRARRATRLPARMEPGVFLLRGI